MASPSLGVVFTAALVVVFYTCGSVNGLQMKAADAEDTLHLEGDEASNSTNASAICGDGTNVTQSAATQMIWDLVQSTGEVAETMNTVVGDVNESITDFVVQATDMVTQLNSTVQQAKAAAAQVGKSDLVDAVAGQVGKMAITLKDKGSSMIEKAQSKMNSAVEKANNIVIKFMGNCDVSLQRTFGSAQNFTVWPQVVEPGTPGVGLDQRRWPGPNFAPGGGSLGEAVTLANGCTKGVADYQEALASLKNTSMDLLEEAGAIVLAQINKLSAKITKAIASDEKSAPVQDLDEGGPLGSLQDAASSAASSATVKGIAEALDTANKTALSLIESAAKALADKVFDEIDDALASLSTAGDIGDALTCQANTAMELGSTIHDRTNPYYVITCALPTFEGYISSEACPTGKQPGDAGCFKATELSPYSCSKGELLSSRQATGGGLVLETVTFSREVEGSPSSESSVATFTLPETGPLSGVLVVAAIGTQNSSSTNATFTVTSVDGCKAAKIMLNVKPSACETLT